jgi:hypothetical protein
MEKKPSANTANLKTFEDTLFDKKKQFELYADFINFTPEEQVIYGFKPSVIFRFKR